MPATITRPAVSASEFAELEEYVELTEFVADYPDEPAPARYLELCRKYAAQGALVGFRHGGPILISVDKQFLDAAMSGVQVGVDNAR